MNKKLIQSLCYVAIAAVAMGFSIHSTMAENKAQAQFQEAVKEAGVNSAKSTKSTETKSSESKSSENKSSESENKDNSKEKSSKDAASKEKATKAESSSAEKAENAQSSSSQEPAVEKTGPYYSYTVTVDDGTLVMYSDPEGTNEIEHVPAGYVGYVIEKSDDYRSLILYKGLVGYCSNMYLEITEIPPEQFPDELVGVNTAHIGTTLFDGAKVGDIENSNQE